MKRTPSKNEITQICITILGKAVKIRSGSNVPFVMKHLTRIQPGAQFETNNKKVQFVMTAHSKNPFKCAICDEELKYSNFT